MKPEVLRAVATGVLATLVLAGMIVLGSRNLAHFDAALVGYMFATMFAVFGIAYRYAMWLQRPPTAMYWKRGWQVFFRPQFLARNLVAWVKRLVLVFGLNLFIWRRGKARWAGHWLIMVGCVMAAAITFPLVFGWVHFKTLPHDLDSYRLYVFGFATISFGVDSLMAMFIFHGLVWSAWLVIAGVMIAMRRRMRERGAAAVQQFGEDFLPLIMLFAISVTGLMLVVSYKWMNGYAYEFLAILHAVAVILTLLWLPFGKFFHIFQRPAQLGVAFYRDVGALSEQAHCRRCGQAFASRMHVEDLITVQQQLDFTYEMPNSQVEHYQWICPKCRRAMLGLAQGEMWQQAREGT
jgi:hypothetical protein